MQKKWSRLVNLQNCHKGLVDGNLGHLVQILRDNLPEKTEEDEEETEESAENEENDDSEQGEGQETTENKNDDKL